jgi:hypothetical protein
MRIPLKVGIYSSISDERDPLPPIKMHAARQIVTAIGPETFNPQPR